VSRCPHQIQSQHSAPVRRRGDGSVDATSSFNADAWEKDLKVEPVITASTDYTSLPTVSRADIDAALVCLAAKARRQILASHRASRVVLRP
jgi:hypothetical protein